MSETWWLTQGWNWIPLWYQNQQIDIVIVPLDPIYLLQKKYYCVGYQCNLRHLKSTYKNQVTPEIRRSIPFYVYLRIFYIFLPIEQSRNSSISPIWFLTTLKTYRILIFCEKVQFWKSYVFQTFRKLWKTDQGFGNWRIHIVRFFEKNWETRPIRSLKN